jgi:1-acyl-sn-glycerol-3-phosphate acyltransferase
MLLQRLLSTVIWIATAVIVVLWVPLLAVIYLVTVPRDPGRYTVGRWFRRSAVAAVAVNPLWEFRTSGYVPPDPRRPYVAVSNHESYADIFLISHLPWEMKWLSKDTIFRIPFMGWMMQMAGDIKVTRTDRSSRAEAVEQCKDRLAKKVSVMIFPEGTRSGTGELLPFKDGAFRIAIELGLPILPMAVAGTRGAMRKGSFLFGRTRAEVRVLEPVSTEGMTLRDAQALRDRVRAAIQSARDDLARELSAAGGAAVSVEASARPHLPDSIPTGN